MAESEHMAMSADEMARMHAIPPDEYAELANPLADDEETLAAGAALFETNCVRCHGPEGWGDGPDAAALDPAPAALARGRHLLMVADGHLFWRISEGGAAEPFNSAMPAWGDVFTETERWQLVTYLRTLSSGRPTPDGRMGHGGNGGQNGSGQNSGGNP